MDEHGIFLCRVRSPNGPFGKRSLHRNRAALLSCFLFLISYNLITRKNINTDLERLTEFLDFLTTTNDDNRINVYFYL